MSFVRLEGLEPRDVAPGVTARFVHSEHLTLAYWHFEPGAPLPEHAHAHEQVSNLIEGEFELTIGGDTMRLGPGAVAVIAPNISHSGKAITRCYIIDVFYPVREDYL